MDTLAIRSGVASAVSKAIKDAGETPFSVAAATGIPRTTLNRRLTGQSPFNVAELDAIAGYLSRKVTDFFDEVAA